MPDPHPDSRRPPTTRRLRLALALRLMTLAALTAVGGVARAADATAERQRVLADTERAFAGTLARRDLASFRQFLAEDAVFVSDDQALRGPEAIAAAWQRFFEGPQAPFAWEPDRVEVQADGPLGLSTGPVRSPTGRLLGRFTSTWRESAPGVWRIVLDIGSPACAEASR